MRRFLVSIFPFVFACSSSSPSPSLDVFDIGQKDLFGPDEGGDIQGDLLKDEASYGEDREEGNDEGVLGPDLGPTCIEGEPCDDLDPCTYGERCQKGECKGGVKYECDDGRPCTLDSCDGKGNCKFELAQGYCLINGLCRKAGERDEHDPCRVCDPNIAVDQWTAAAEGEICAPNLDPCLVAPKGGRCKQGTCEPITVEKESCDDQNPCTKDECIEGLGCIHSPISTGECILESACEPGVCIEGQCVVPEGQSCDDHNPCTQDLCDPILGCSHVALDNVPCDDGSVCTVFDTCKEGKCVGEPLNCNDGNICTLDACHPVTGCYHEVLDNACCEAGASICDDGNVCTDDSCNPTTLECEYTFNQAACDDHDPCTILDACEKGVCKGRPMDCEDGNPCTLDLCSQGKCIHTPLDGLPCDDGLECSTFDHCENGVCVADKSGCLCTPTFSPSVSKVTSLSISASGNPGDGLDLDQNPSTCAPQTNCSSGVDNSLGPIASLGNSDIQKGLDSGQILLLFEHRGLRTDGKPYTLALYAGKGLDPSNPSCDFQHDKCKYLVDSASFDADCNPKVAFDNAKIVSGKLTAGGKDYSFPFELPLLGNVTLTINLYYARIEAQVTVVGNEVKAIQGILGGAVPKQELKDAIMALPKEVEDQLPLPKEQIVELLDLLVQADIDGDGDGKKESASIGIKFSGISGLITGVK